MDKFTKVLWQSINDEREQGVYAPDGKRYRFVKVPREHKKVQKELKWYIRVITYFKSFCCKNKNKIGPNVSLDDSDGGDDDIDCDSMEQKMMASLRKEK